MTTTPICVLGMRTGSSLTTRALILLGLEAGTESELMPSRPGDNPTGYWEQQPLVDLNEELLAELGGSWWDPPALDPGWNDDPALDPLKERARHRVADLFPPDVPWVWKDPRAAITMPFWQDVMGPMRYVLTVRSPADVASSLHARDALVHPWLESSRLYLRYLHESLVHTEGTDRVVVFYDDWFDDFEAQLNRLSLFATGDPPAPERTDAVRKFLEEGLRHHRASADDAGLDPETAEAYALLRARTDDAGRLEVGVERQVAARWAAVEERMSHDPDGLRARARGLWRIAEQHRRDYLEAARSYEELYLEYQSSERARHELGVRAEVLESDLDRARQGIRELTESVSWRVTAPLRSAKRRFVRVE